MSLQNQIRTWWSNFQLQRSTATFRVVCYESGITQISENRGQSHGVQLAWEQITDVFAFKRDCFTVDQISIVVGNSDLKEWVEVTEDDDGYGELILQLPLYLSGCPTLDSWFQRVALPPFETQWTHIYQKAAATD